MAKAQQTALRRRKRLRFNAFDIFVVLFCILFALLCFYPLWYVILVSVTPYAEYVQNRLVLLPPANFDFQYYKAIFSTSVFSRAIGVSVFKTAVGTALAVCVTSMMAYGVSKQNVPGMKLVNVLVVITMYFSGGLVPTYFLYRDIGIIKTIWPMILPAALNVSYYIIMRNYFLHSVPRELEEAALLDGCNQVKAFFRVVLPTSMAMVAAITLFIGVQHWNDWYNFMMYVNVNALQPLAWMLRRVLVEPQFVNNLANDAAAAMGYSPPPMQLRMTTIVVATLPILVVYPFLQKHFTKGMLIGAVKE